MGKIAFLFPGQGAQKVGMGAEFYRGDDAARALFDRAGEILEYDLARLCFEGPEDDLRQTIHTQPALYVTSCAALAALRSRANVTPFAVAGHSVGEYATLYAAGSVRFEKGLQLVRLRAELMQKAAATRPGTMAAVLGLEGDAVREICDAVRRETKRIVAVANYNCPGQVVISGENDAVEQACRLARERGAKVRSLAVSGAFHSPLMVTAGDALYPALRDALFQQATVPVVTNVSAEYSRSGADFAPLLTMQVSSSVRWEESMRRLLDDGVDTFLELGVGDVLAGLMKRIDKSVRVLSVQDMASLEAAVALLNEASREPARDPDAEQTSTGMIFHVTKREVWEQARQEGIYRGDTLDTEGFIHCSRADQAAAVANSLFRARHGLALLCIDAGRVAAEIRYEEAANGQLYPHIYGPLNADAVLKVLDFEPGPDGRFTLPPGIATERDTCR